MEDFIHLHVGVGVVCVVLLPLSDASLLQGHLGVANQLFTSALVILAVHYFLTVFLTAFFFDHLRRHFARVTYSRITNEGNDSDNFVHLKRDMAKLNYNFSSMLLMLPLLTAFYLTMAFDDTFFLDMTLSQSPFSWKSP